MWTEAAKLLDSRAAASSVTARKLAIKLVQRIGLTFLPATVASWRYQQTSVSINVSLSDVALPSNQLPQPANTATPTCQGQSQAGQSLSHQQQQQGTLQHIQSNGAARAALQPSQFVNMEGPASPPAGKQAGIDQPPVQPATGKQAGADQPPSQPASFAPAAGWQQSGPVQDVTSAEAKPANLVVAGSTLPGAASGTDAQDPVGQEPSEEDDLEVPQEIEEVRLPVFHPPCAGSDRSNHFCRLTSSSTHTLSNDVARFWTKCGSS